jgi:probable rRNA maturation factor
MPNKASVSNIRFYFQADRFYLHNRTLLKQFLLQLFRKERVRVSSLNYIFCSDEYLLSINKAYLQHDFYTDIVTFNLSKPKEPIIGEIYISIDRVKENALQFKQAYYKELHRVVFHGALHLCGYKDKSESEISVMRKKEDAYISLFYK